jgi:hypothetical protein
MATNTYIALDKVVVPSTTSTIAFTGIDQTYTDIIIVVDASITSGESNLDIRFNGDTASNYSYTQMAGTGSSAISTYADNQTAGRLDYYGFMSTGRYTNTIQIYNYASTSLRKTVISDSGNSANGVSQVINMWRSTAAITSITLTGVNIAAGSTFSLYGIRAEAVSPTPKATGGAIYDDELYYYHAFGATGVFTPTTSITADILVVAGGGCGGGFAGGGGGAGGLIGFASQSLTTTNYTCTVGGGGAGIAVAYNAGGGNNGTNSTFQGLTAAVGGGYGGPTGNVAIGVGNGGSGGGRGNPSGAGSRTTGQGFAGAELGTANGGGGGAGGIGDTLNGGTGGIGATSTTLVGGTAGPYSFINAMGAATGTGQFFDGNYYYAGGGGGGCQSNGGIGGGGGAGVFANGTSGTPSSGGGGGGACGSTSFSGNGGSGVIIVRYLKA